jgi:CRISPR-associated protein Cas2
VTSRALSGFRLMWLMVMFDVPVATKSERKAATDFRNALLDIGFEMVQYSVYVRFCTSLGRVQVMTKTVQGALPSAGKVKLLLFTDKQYERSLSYSGKVRQTEPKPPEQFQLF